MCILFVWRPSPSPPPLLFGGMVGGSSHLTSKRDGTCIWLHSLRILNKAITSKAIQLKLNSSTSIKFRTNQLLGDLG